MTRLAEARRTERRPQMTALALFLAASALSGCPATAPTPPPARPTPRQTTAPPKPAPPKPTRAFGDARTIYTSTLRGAWRHTLLGVDAARGEVFLRAELPGKTPRFVIDTIDLRTGALADRWEATPDRARKLVGGYPRFVAPTGDDASGLTRFATMITRSGPWSTREAPSPLTVRPSPRGDRIIRGEAPAGGQDGDWLMMRDTATSQPRRLDVGLAASYAPNFSPDGQRVAWIGGHARFARRGARVGYVLHVADLRTSPPTLTAIPTVRDVLRAPIWSADGARLFALGRVGARQCAYEVAIPSHKATSLWCHDGPLDLMVLPDGHRALALASPAQGDGPRALRLLDARQQDGPVGAALQLKGVSGMGPFGLPHGDGRALVFTRHGQGIALIDLTSWRVVAEHVLPDGDAFLSGRHTARIVHDELIMLRHQGAQTALVGLRVP